MVKCGRITLRLDMIFLHTYDLSGMFNFTIIRHSTYSGKGRYSKICLEYWARDGEKNLMELCY
jgi:hypothetical protein